MFDFSIAEILVIVVVILIAVKPEDLPSILRTAGKAFSKVKKLASEFTSTLEEATKEIEDTGKEMKQLVDLEGNLRDVYDISDLDDYKKK